ncbi:pentapeptide repeat-containing protein [bacterium]|nr:pentapeptide repeat-containing protein [bacterium]
MMGFAWWQWTVAVLFLLLIALLIAKAKLKLTPKQTLALIPLWFAAPLDWLAWSLLIFFRRSFWKLLGQFFPQTSKQLRLAGLLAGWALGIVVVILMILLVIWFMPKWYAGMLPVNVPGETGVQVTVNKLEHEEGFRALLVQIVVQIVVGLTLLTGLYRSWQELRLAREGQLTERFTRAVDQLGHKTRDVRIGGIFALEKIAYSYKEYHWTVMEVLTAYIRERAPWPSMEPDEKQAAQGDEGSPSGSAAPLEERRPAADIQIALTVIGRRNLGHEKVVWRRLDLRRTDLRGAELQNAHLEHAALWWAHLEDARLYSAHLEGAWLIEAHLEDARLHKAHLEGADLRGAYMEGAHDLTWEQLESAKSFEGARLPDYLVSDIEGYRKAKEGGADLVGYPVPEGL